MGKPKKYIGETWSNPWDDRGKDYRWDDKKQEYVESFGASPASAIGRSLKGLSSALIGEDESKSDLGSLADIIENIAIIKRTFDNNKKLGEETKDVKVENVAKDFSAYYDLDPFVDFSNRTDDASQNFSKQVQNLNPKDPEHQLLAKIVGTNKLNSRGSKEENTNYQMMRKTADERQKRRMEDALAKGNPLKKFELDKQRSGTNIPAGTPVNELFKKPEDVNKVEQDKQIETEVKNENKEIETKDNIIEKAPEITDSIDGKIGDFPNPDDWKNKNLLGNMA